MIPLIAVKPFNSRSVWCANDCKIIGSWASSVDTGIKLWLDSQGIGNYFLTGAINFSHPKRSHGLLGSPNLLLIARDPFVGDKVART